MRYIIKGAIIALVTIFIAFKFGIPLFYTLTTKGSQYQERISHALVSISYTLDEEKWTVFPLPLPGKLLRVVTNANLPGVSYKHTKEGLRYAFQFQILDKDQNVLSDRIYHHRTKLTIFKDKEEGTFTSSFYVDTDLTPSDSRSMRVDLEGIDGEKFIRFRLVSSDVSLHEIVLRLYVYFQPGKKQPGYLWRRLSDKQKERLAKGNVYPHELLAEQEKYALIQRNWRPLGPLGAEGKDYGIRKLYILQEIEGEDTDFNLLPSGIYIKDGHRGIMPIPEGGGRVRLEFLNTAGETPQNIQLRWYGRGIDKRSSHYIPWHEEARTWFEHDFEGGLVEISTFKNILANAFLTEKDEEREITPEPLYVRTYISEKGEPVEFNIHHTGKQSTPLKVSLRYRLPHHIRDDRSKGIYATYTFLNKEGEAVKSGRLSIPQILSLYDEIAGNNAAVDISEPASYYFNIPPGITGIRLSSEFPVLITAHTRPEKLTRDIKVPEDYYAAVLPEEKQPPWFSLRPKNFKDLTLKHRSALLTLQHRPPRESEDLMSGYYHWEDYHPSGNWSGRYILTPGMQTDLPLKKTASYYSLLPLNRDLEVDFPGTAGLRVISPRLIFVRKSSGPMSVTLLVDGKIHFTGKISGTRGEILLPPVPLGKHSIKLVSSGEASFFLNRIEPDKRFFLRRMVNRFDKRGLSFTYNKKSVSDEILSVRFYSPLNNRERNIIFVRINTETEASLEPYNGWTFQKYRFRVRPDDTEAVPVLNTYDEFLEQGQLFFIRFGSDLPPGSYPIRFELESGTGGYLSLHKVTPGIFEERRFYKEKGLADD